MNYSKFTQALILISVLTFQACTITNEGPRGPRGYDGIDGEDGAQVYSSSSTIFANDFEIVDEFVSINEFEWDLLDESTVDEGLVLGYIRFNGTTSWHALPLSTPFENDLVNLRYVFDINSFDLLVEGEVANNNEVNEDLFDGDVLRVVAIPPSRLFKGKSFDYRNFNQVSSFYNIQW